MRKRSLRASFTPRILQFHKKFGPRSVLKVTADGKIFMVHLGGYNQMDLLSGKRPVKRNDIFYFDAGGNLNALRYKDCKAHFTIAEYAHGSNYHETA